MIHSRLFTRAGLIASALSAQLAYAQAPAESLAPPAPVRTTEPQSVNRATNVAAVATVVHLSLSSEPTEAELRGLSAFHEPLCRTQQSTSDLQERKDLALAINAWLQRSKSDDYQLLEAHIARYPEGVWTASLQRNLGTLYYTTGYFSKAMAVWKAAWLGAKSGTTTEAIAVANSAVAEWSMMLARLGRMEELQAVFQETSERKFQGNALVQMERAQEGLWNMNNRPGIAFRCGPYALNLIEQQLQGQAPEGFLNDPEVQSPKTGFSLTQLKDFAQRKLGRGMQIAKRAPGAALIVPAVVHWEVGHFGALLQEKNGVYLLKDPTFGNDTWMTKAALDGECSGYFLVPEGDLPAGWTTVSDEEGAQHFGKGHSGNSDPDESRDCSKQNGGNGCDGKGMATYSFHTMLAGLRVYDIPVGYTPARGPAVDFKVVYNMKEAGQPASPTYSNFSPQWENAWVSYLEDNPGVPTENVKVNLRSGGAETYKDYNSTTQTFGKSLYSDSFLVRLTADSYERRFTDGSKEVYARAIGTTGPNRKVFLSQIVDPQGNAVTLQYSSYGSGARLSTITDATGLVSTFSYDDASAPYLVTRIHDPYGRYATFSYQDYSGVKRLVKIRDTIGIESSFEYNANGQVTALATPYGRTTFTFGSPNVAYGLIRWIEALDPQGDKERIEYHLGQGTTGIPYTLPTSEIVTVPGLTFATTDMDDRNTFYWDKKAMYHAAGDYSKAHLYHWLQKDGADVASGVLESEKPALEARVWYRYPGQSNGPTSIGTSGSPIRVARKIENGTVINGVSQLSTAYTQADYNTQGNITKHIDALGRETMVEYAANGQDVSAIKQKIGGTYQTIQSYSYDPTYPAHCPKTTTDASGQTTTYTYNASGQVETVTNPLNETTTFVYETSNTANGYGKVKQIIGPVSGSTVTYTFDGYDRVRTVVDTSGHTTTYDYDLFDRVRLVTYPDTTTQQYEYDRLSMVAQKDRQGRWSRTTYNALRQPTYVTDALGYTTQMQWCKCGALQKLIDAKGNTTRWRYDVQGRVYEKEYANGKKEAISYEPRSGRVMTLHDAKLQRKEMLYNLDGTLKEVSYPNASAATPTVSYTYHPDLPAVATMTDGTGLTSYTYHPVGQLGALQRATVNGPLTGNTDLITYGYDQLGRSKTRNVGPNGNENTVQLNFDSLGRIGSIVNNLGTFTNVFVGQTSRIDYMDYPNGQRADFDYYDNLGDQRLKTIHNLASGANPSSTISRFDYTYSPEGSIQTWKRQFGSAAATSYSFGYDAANQLTSATLAEAANPNAVLKRFSYQYDKSGNRTSEQRDNQVAQAVSNSANQITGLSGGGKILVAGATNEPAKVEVNGVPATVDSANRYQAWVDVVPGNNTLTVEAEDYSPNANTSTKSWSVNITGTPARSFSYDDNGNTLSDGVRAYEWDAENRLVKITQGGNSYEFVYDGNDRRVVEKVNGVISLRWVWSDAEIVEQRDASGVVMRRFFGGGEQRLGGADAGLYCYTRDHLGSIRELLDSGANVRARYDYDPYGRREKLVGDLDCDFAFTGHYYHATTGLHLALYRAYDAELGRWLSRDPLEEDGGLNVYGYVYNDPIRMIDFFGLEGVSISHFNNGKWRLDSEYPHGGDGGSIHIQVDGKKYDYNTKTGQFSCRETGRGLPKNVMKEMKGKQFKNAMKNATNRVNTKGGFAPKFGGGMARYIPLIATVGLVLSVDNAQGDIAKYLEAVKNGDQLGADVAAGDIAKLAGVMENALFTELSQAAEKAIGGEDDDEADCE